MTRVMKQSEERALEKYPPLIVAEQLVPNATVVEFNPKRTDLNAYQRAKFQEGYEQAIKDIREWVEEQKRLIEESSANDIRKGASIVILDNLMKDFSL